MAGQPIIARRVVVLGASAGGVEALSTVVSGFPDDLPAAVLVVLHVAAKGTSVLPDILSRRGPLPATHAVDGERLYCGRIYVAPPDRHITVDRGAVRLSPGPKDNGVRPSIDTLFRSAANAFGPDVVAAVLTGTLDDGTAGLIAVTNGGGITIAQDPEDAAFPGMPASAVRVARPDFVLPAADIAAAVVRAVLGDPTAHAAPRG
ncbi:MAG: two-component system, chemotaxis family, protein-glutamate methylesterase/glutaminase [Actinomycetota bacterium]|jgi:two-component system chemotaxis response regulator CheB|nr:two-component system, chemotaxis family, protein-glutamate methylesterase/glutaminase [Actinomycetota bacterium]